MGDLKLDENVFCEHLQAFYNSWKEVGPSDAEFVGMQQACPCQFGKFYSFLVHIPNANYSIKYDALKHLCTWEADI